MNLVARMSEICSHEDTRDKGAQACLCGRRSAFVAETKRSKSVCAAGLKR
jgi:hypothetical protein